MRLPETAHTSRPWRIHDIAHDFALEDVWSLPLSGDRDDFPALVQFLSTLDPLQSSSRVVRTLFAIRFKAGALLGWDTPDAAQGPSIRDRVPFSLRGRAGPAFAVLPSTRLYLTDDEWAVEIVNLTVHGILHVGWIRDDQGRGHHAQLAIHVKRNGLLGATYMAAITPFRHLLVYPLAMREIGRQWRARAGGRAPAHA